MSIYRTLENPNAERTVVLTHGLNVHPRAMLPLAEGLSASRARVVIVQLAGHDGSLETRYDPSAERWKANLADVIRSEIKGGVPLSLVGYSLGGLVTTAVLDADPSLPISNVVLLAPALSVRSFLIPGLALSRLLPRRMTTCSVVPPAYAATRFITVGWYASLYELLLEAKKLTHAETLGKIPCRILMSRFDELVSNQGIERWIRNNQLPAWSLEIIETTRRKVQYGQHLLIDPRLMRKEQWDGMIAKIIAGIKN